MRICGTPCTRHEPQHDGIVARALRRLMPSISDLMRSTPSSFPGRQAPRHSQGETLPGKTRRAPKVGVQRRCPRSRRGDRCHAVAHHPTSRTAHWWATDATAGSPGSTCCSSRLPHCVAMDIALDTRPSGPALAEREAAVGSSSNATRVLEPRRFGFVVEAAAGEQADDLGPHSLKPAFKISSSNVLAHVSSTHPIVQSAGATTVRRHGGRKLEGDFELLRYRMQARGQHVEVA